MAEIVIKKYVCDVCKAEFDNKDMVEKTTVPCRGTGFVCTNTKIDLCRDCREKLVEAVWNNFAEIMDDYGVVVKAKKF